MSKETEKRKVLPPAHIKKKPTETPYQAYKKEVNRLLNKAQIGGGWEVTFTSSEPLNETASAKCTYNMMSRWVRFSFNSKVANTVKLARLSVKHEFGHFVTCRLERLAVYRFTTEDEIREEMEAIARIFEKIA